MKEEEENPVKDIQQQITLWVGWLTGWLAGWLSYSFFFIRDVDPAIRERSTRLFRSFVRYFLLSCAESVKSWFESSLPDRTFHNLGSTKIHLTTSQNNTKSTDLLMLRNCERAGRVATKPGTRLTKLWLWRVDKYLWSRSCISLHLSAPRKAGAAASSAWEVIYFPKNIWSRGGKWISSETTFAPRRGKINIQSEIGP